MENMNKKTFTLLGSDKRSYQSDTPGTFGGYRRGKIYGRLDCPSALRAIAKGGYVNHRVFFADEETAIAAGYRPCGNCMRVEYAEWKKEMGK
jgi:methylphosphotriester-DNA--protein-cysteine methyltransferase